MRFRGIARCLGFAISLAYGGVTFAQPSEPASEGPSADRPAPVDSAAAAPSTDRSTEARELGRALLAEGSADQAAQVFLTAYEASGDPSLLVEVAEALLADGDGPGAVEALERFLVELPVEAEAEADAARRRIAEIEQMPSVLDVSSIPLGAEVRVDGDAVGVTPLQVEVAPGEHSVELALAGHVSASERVVVPFGSRRPMRLELLAEPAEEPAEAPPVALPLEPTLERETSATPAIWATASLSAAALLTGTIFGFKALSEESDFVIAPTHAGADRGERYSLVADIAFGVAAASAVTALVFWLTGDDDEEGAETARLRIVGAPSGAGLGGEVGF